MDAVCEAFEIDEDEFFEMRISVDQILVCGESWCVWMFFESTFNKWFGHEIAGFRIDIYGECDGFFAAKEVQFVDQSGFGLAAPN